MHNPVGGNMKLWIITYGEWIISHDPNIELFQHFSSFKWNGENRIDSYACLEEKGIEGIGYWDLSKYVFESNTEAANVVNSISNQYFADFPNFSGNI